MEHLNNALSITRSGNITVLLKIPEYSTKAVETIYLTHSQLFGKLRQMSKVSVDPQIRFC